MSEIDIRNKGDQEVDVIRFADDDAQLLCKRSRGYVAICDDGDDTMYIHSADHAEHLILALQEAISRGWLV